MKKDNRKRAHRPKQAGDIPKSNVPTVVLGDARIRWQDIVAVAKSRAPGRSKSYNKTSNLNCIIG